MTPILPYLWINVKAVKFEQVALSDRESLKTVF